MKQILKIVSILLFPFVIGKLINTDDPGIEKVAPAIISAYPEHIAGAYTGGFGEQSCHSCHFDYDLNHPEGELVIAGIEETFEPAEAYKINITVKREDMSRAGFQMTARFEDGSQAGRFELNEDLTTTPNIDSNVSYVQHGAGMVQAEGGEKKWQVTWIAPARRDPVIINVAANAANGDASEFGDWIYVKEIQLN